MTTTELPTERIVALDGGQRATFRVFGDGDPLLSFPGGPGFPAMLQLDDAELLRDRFAVHLIDPHGSGGSSPPDDPAAYDHLGHARFYEEVRRALGLDRVSVHGVSFGGVMALTYASLYPDAVARCIAVSAAAMGEDVAGEDVEEEFERNLARHSAAPWYPEAREVIDAWTERVLATDDAAEVDRMMRAVLPLYLAEPDRADVRARLARLDEWIRSDLAATKAWEGGIYQTIDIRPLLPAIRCPTLVVAGELDFICGPAQARTIADLVPDVERAIISGCGHEPAIEEPDAYRRTMFDWLDRRGGS